MVARTQLIVTVYLQCLSCFNYDAVAGDTALGVKEPKHETTRFNLLPKLKVYGK